MARLGLETNLIDRDVYRRTLARFREAGIALPTFAELMDPSTIPAAVARRLAEVDPDSAHPLNLFRVHWFNDGGRRGRAATPAAIELAPELTGAPARIVLVLGELFPMIRAHKVLAAYGCLAPRVVTGQFDPTRSRAIWPSTGNYCRGGVAISRILGCRGVAVLPENMSRERFEWLERWVAEPSDIIRTPGSESNVKEIYDACAALERDPANIVFNQFCEYGNYIVHRLCTGAAFERVFHALAARNPRARLAAFVAATGSAGTLAAGDHLKRALGARIAAVEAVECPTLLMNGFGEHNIQGIGDKHVPLIHNVMNTDVVVGVSDRATDTLLTLFNTEEGRAYLVDRRGVDPALVARLGAFGISGIGNIVAAAKLAHYYDLGPDDVILTVATDSAELYLSEVRKAEARWFGNRFDAVAAGETHARFMAGAGVDHVLELTHVDRKRIFNLGYFTWVEQQGVSVDDFTVRARQSFWDGLLELAPAWDALIEKFNAESGVAARLQ